MGPDAKLDALGNELEAMVTSMTKDPMQFFRDPHGPQITRLKGLIEEMQAAGQQQLAQIVAGSKANAEKAKALAAEMEEKRKQAEAARKAREEAAAAAARKPAWPPETGGLPLTFWFEKEFSPPEDQIKALTAELLAMAGVRPPASASAPSPNGGPSPRPGRSFREQYEALAHPKEPEKVGGA